MLGDSAVIESGILLLLILFNGFLAMSEMAIVSARKVRLQQLAKEGHSGAQTALDLANSPSKLLASVQIGITLIGIFAGAFGGATIAGKLAVPLGTIEFIAPYADFVALAFVVVIVTTLSLLFGELIPKRLALSNSEQIAIIVSKPIRFVELMFSPVVRLLSYTTDKMLHAVTDPQNAEPPVTEEEVKIMIEQGAVAGVFDREEETIMKRVLRLGDRRVHEIMTPRPQVVCLDVDAATRDNIQEMIDTHHSYFPVYAERHDNIIGIVSAKSALAKRAETETQGLRPLLIEPLYVAESMPTLQLLTRFKTTGKHIALVIDEYGGMAGVVTVLDVLQAIVGDLPDSVGQEDQSIVQRADGSWLVEGILPRHEMCDFFEIEEQALEEVGDFQTLGGFIMSVLGHIPKAGEFFEFAQYRFEVVDMDGHRVDKILVQNREVSES
jgi:putative hemolysin